MDIEEKMCRYQDYFTKQGKYIQGKYIRENGLEGKVEDVMEKIQCRRFNVVEKWQSNMFI